jgi:hypothetical protein
MFHKLSRFTGRGRTGVAVAAAALAVAALTPLAASSANAAPTADATQRAPSGTTGVCNYWYEWLGVVRFPLQPDPHAAYSYVVPSNQAGADGVAFMVTGDFVHAAWTSWMAYTGVMQPFSVANFVNNPPANSNNPVQPNAGSISPFLAGNQMLATPRKFTLLFTPNGYTGPIASTLAGVPRSSIPAPNIKPYPTAGHGNTGDWWLLGNRNYAALPGYNPGGSTEDTFPTVTAVDLATGQPVDCQQYNQIPDRLQRPPTDPPNALNYGPVPVRFQLKNGSIFTGMDDPADNAVAQFGPTNPNRRVVFTRPPLLPGGDVATVPPPENCSGYVMSTLDPNALSLIRVPHIANYTDNENVTASTTYPNPANPSQPWETAYQSVVQYGNSSGLYLPNTPFTTALANAEFKIDRTGGSTILVWPRNLPASDQIRVFAYAHRQGWALVRGGTRGPETGANLGFRIKASASDYFGATSKLPCYFGSSANPQNPGVPWSSVPVGTQNAPSQWVATAANMGKRVANGVISAAPQGVTCPTVRNLTSGRCVTELRNYITATGGSYFAAAP